MAKLKISIGQYSDKGRKEVNQDFYGVLIPDNQALITKGIAIAIADGISSSNVSKIAAEATIKSFLTDYYCTSEAWSVKTSAQRIISATNSWLYAQTKRSIHAYEMDKGYVCTLSAMIIKSLSAHIFHIGDSRIYMVHGEKLEQLTNDHLTIISTKEKYLGRAMGMAQNIEIDYRKIDLNKGDIFLFVTDGVYEFFDDNFVTKIIKEHADNLDEAARLIVNKAYAEGSKDNLTAQIVRIDDLPHIDDLSYGEMEGIIDNEIKLPLPPLLSASMEFDGYKILREIHATFRSHIYLAKDMKTGKKLALKIPSIDMREDEQYLKRFMMEGWIAKRINSDHVLKAVHNDRRANYLYLTNEYIEGQTLDQWMIDNPNPNIEIVRNIVEQIAKGLRAFHRKEMIHQDLRPQNIMIDNNGIVKIIDFGSTKVAGVIEALPKIRYEDILGTIQYSAPEYFIGGEGTKKSDFFSLGVITYQMLSAKLPYGTQIPKIRNMRQLKKLKYTELRHYRKEIPIWIDNALKKMLDPEPMKRYDSLSEFLKDLRIPNKSLMGNNKTPIAMANPLLFWQVTTIILAILLLISIFA